jgi:serine/threonine protein kinase
VSRHRQDLCCLPADLKGGNVLLKSAQNSRGFEAKVADFGLARQLGVESRVHSNKYGTVTHCPPELLLNGTISKVGKHQTAFRCVCE